MKMSWYKTVIVTFGGMKYHKPDCPTIVGKRTKPIGLKVAIDLGYLHCNKCWSHDLEIEEYEDYVVSNNVERVIM